MSPLLLESSFIPKSKHPYIMYGMTLRKRMIIGIGALILITSLTIIIIAGRSIYTTGVSHAYNVLEMNNDNLYSDVKSKLSETKNYLITSIYNNTKFNQKTLRPRYLNTIHVYDGNYLFMSFSSKDEPNLVCQKINYAPKELNIFYRTKNRSNSTICMQTSVSINNKRYDAVLNISPTFFNRRLISAPTLVVAPEQFEVNVETYYVSSYEEADFKRIVEPSQIIRAKSNFIISEGNVVLLQEVPNTNLRMISYNSESSTNSAYRNFLYSSFGIMLLVLTASIIIFLLVMNSFLKPIKELCTASKCFADGVYDSKLDPTKFAEINELINSFNTMIKKIQLREKELYSLNQNLEDEVNKKTSELLHAAKMASLGTLSSGIAHEFNNILGALIGHVSLALEKKDPKEMEEALQIALMASERACDIVSRLQDFAKKREGEHELYNINEAITNTIKLIERDFLSNNIKIEKNLSIKALVRGSQSQMEQVVLNLLINSRHAMPTGGTIKLSSSISDGRVTIRIHDTGHGIPVEIKDRIFEPFFTTKGVVGMGKSFGSQDNEGLGLGLSVSLGIIEDHKGSIRLVETSQKGTIFEIILPLAD
jgi:signal transduction histidine kinase